jgi:hypothetical protein
MTGKGPCSLDELVAQADLALYEAKNSGRDLVRCQLEPNVPLDSHRAKAANGSG